MTRRRGACLIVLAILWTVLVSCIGAVDLPDADYSVETVTEYIHADGNSVTLMYPAIYGYADTAAEHQINERIADHARAQYQRQGLIATEEGGYEYSVNQVEITLMTEGFLSAYIGGMIVSEVSGNTLYFSYTINCDIQNTVLYTTEELISDYDRLSTLFKNGAFIQDFGYEDLEKQISFADMIVQYKVEYGIYPHIYFTEGSIGFLIEVVPVLDGYAGYTLPIHRAIDSLNTNNPLVACVTGEN